MSNHWCKEKVEVEVHLNVTDEEFRTNIYPRRIPAVLRGLDIGECKEKWTTDYLCQHGGHKEVKVHVSPSSQMDFINKNFMYRTLPFDELVKRASATTNTDHFIHAEEKYYLRSLGDDLRKDIADVRKQFISLAEDIKFPKFFSEDDFFSSVFRIASHGTQLWTHYDVMDNILIQVSGHKRAVLFSPRDATNLYLSGDKSEVLDIDNPDFKKYPKFANVTWYECVLKPGDVLFIPALWFHNVISLEFGVAVNVFWRQLDSSFYEKKDLYGNKDPSAASRAMQILDRALKTLDELPLEYKDFYARRMVAKIESRAYANDLV
ncbi:tRNA wybutosine-synthesizing protein 5-like [Ptychodera flava]|uniref:tRNA wybutosine-synthesizing protein 5-like n=1 Tax=Ptychodera flava TaxID=63121 RepID=UPI00396A1170